MPEPYRLADLAAKQISKTFVRLETETKRRCLIDGFDDLNVMRLVDVLYENLSNSFRTKCGELYRLRYKEVCKWLTGEDEDIIDELVEMYLAGLLDEPNEEIGRAHV